MKDFTINSAESIKGFFTYLMKDLNLNFHPDTSMYDYVNAAGNETFTPEEADHLDEYLLLCIEYCYINKLDIYDLAMQTQAEINEEEETKVFFCTWGSSDVKAMNSYDDDSREATANAFTTDNGYEQEDLNKISALTVGETYTAIYGNHTIKRIK